jgi:translation initiation factor IF-2
VLDDIAKAREIARARAFAHVASNARRHQATKVSFDASRRSSNRLGDTGEKVTLNLIIRADVRGSIEAILKELGKLEHPEVQIKVLQASVGGITSPTSRWPRVGRGHHRLQRHSRRSGPVAGRRAGVEIRRYDIIYKVTDDIEAMLEGKLKPEERRSNWAARWSSRSSASAASARGRLPRALGHDRAQLPDPRDPRQPHDRRLPARFAPPREGRRQGSPRGMECGIKLAGFNDIKEGDVLEAYKIEEVARTL